MANIFISIVNEKCPFCGSESIASEDAKDLGMVRGAHQWSLAFVYCQTCGTRGPQKDTLKEAVESWDVRK